MQVGSHVTAVLLALGMDDFYWHFPERPENVRFKAGEQDEAHRRREVVGAGQQVQDVRAAEVGAGLVQGIHQ